MSLGECRGPWHLLQSPTKELHNFLDDHSMTIWYPLQGFQITHTICILHIFQGPFKFCLFLILDKKYSCFSVYFQTFPSSSSILSQSPSQVMVVHADGNSLPCASQVLEVSSKCHYFEYISPLVLDHCITYFS